MYRQILPYIIIEFFISLHICMFRSIFCHKKIAIYYPFIHLVKIKHLTRSPYSFIIVQFLKYLTNTVQLSILMDVVSIYSLQSPNFQIRHCLILITNKSSSILTMFLLSFVYLGESSWYTTRPYT